MNQSRDISIEITELEWVLRRISAIIKQRGRQILNDFPITTPQFIALQWLKECGDMTIGDLSAKMYLANSTTTDLIDRMESTGLVERIRSQSDRRVVQIHLLDKGKQIIEEVIHNRQAYLAEVFSHFDKETMTTIHKSLMLLFEEMEKQ